MHFCVEIVGLMKQSKLNLGVRKCSHDIIFLSDFLKLEEKDI